MSRIGEDIKYAMNPLPPVTDEEIINRAGLNRIPSIVSPTQMRWKARIDNYVHSFILDPGDTISLRGNEIKIFLTEHEEFGGVVVDDPNDVDEVTEAAKRGLMAAIKFYRDRGQMRVDDYQNRHGLDSNQIERRKHGDLWKYFYNEALADYLQETLDGLKNGKSSKKLVNTKVGNTDSAEGDDS